MLDRLKGVDALKIGCQQLNKKDVVIKLTCITMMSWPVFESAGKV